MVASCLRVWIICMASTLAASAALAQADPQQLRTRDYYWQLANQHFKQGNYSAARDAIQNTIALERRLLGEDHRDLVRSYELLCWIEQDTLNYAAAEKARLKVMEVRTRLDGPKHWMLANDRWNLDLIRIISKLDQKEFLEVGRAAIAHRQVLDAWRKGEYAGQLDIIERVLETRKTYLGENNPDYAASLALKASLYERLGELKLAEEYYNKSLQARKPYTGEEHPDYAGGLSNLGMNYYFQGDNVRAGECLLAAVRIAKATRGEMHAETGLFQNNLASVYLAQGDFHKCQPLLEQAIVVAKKTQGDGHPDFALRIMNYGVLLSIQGNKKDAEKYVKRSLEIYSETLGNRHPQYAMALQNLAAIHHGREEFSKAIVVLQEALDITKQYVGENHPTYAMRQGNLAAALEQSGDLRGAEALYRKSLEVYRNRLGEQHVMHAAMLNTIAVVLRAQGEHDRAKPLYLQAQRIVRNVVESYSSVMSERQQLAVESYYKPFRDSYLAFAQAARLPGAEVYEAIFAEKGAAFAQQRSLREFRNTLKENPEAAKEFAELQDVAKQLAATAFAPPATANKLPAWQARVADLSERNERIESKLVKLSLEFRTAIAQRRPSVDELRKSLAADIALIDYLQYSPVERWKTGLRKVDDQLLAFVIRRDKPVEMVDLGPVTSIRETIIQWRDLLTKRSDEEFPAVASQTRRLVWDPLQPHLDGAKTILISPDGPLSFVPFSALPGTAKGRFLIEEVSIAMMPVLQMLPRILAAGPPRIEAQPSLLVVGGIDFGKGKVFSPLPGTREEARQIEKQFRARFPAGTVRAFEGIDATKAAFQREAPKHRWLHIATHGVYESRDDSFVNELSAKQAGDIMKQGVNPLAIGGIGSHHPALFAMLAFANANQLPEEGRDDNVLRAIEVAESELGQVDLVVLSACQTGLGRVADGEGLLGFQRSFQVAGARSTVATLWSVHDLGTRLLMERFYESMLDAKAPHSRVEALRAAQIWMIRHGRPALNDALKAQRSNPLPGPATARLPAYYWAAFVLSGDWR